MAKPPPPPPSKATKTAVEAFGSALDLAVSRVDVALEDGPESEIGMPARPDIPIFGEHTPEPSQLPPSLGHLGLVDAKLELSAPVAVTRIEVSAPQSRTGAGPWILLLLCAAGLGAVAWYFLGRGP